MNCRLLMIFVTALGLNGCGNQTSSDPLKTPVQHDFIREFRDKKDSAEDLDLNPEDLAEELSNLVSDPEPTPIARVEPRRSKIEIYVFKNPEFETYFYYDKSKKVVGRKLTVLLMMVDGKLQTAAFTSTGDPNRRAFNQTKQQWVNGSETRNGTYSIESQNIHAISNAYNRAEMNFASYILGTAIAIHQTGEDHYKDLGRKASMGCLRLNRAAAKEVFETIKASYELEKNYSAVTVNIRDSGVSELFADQKTAEREVLLALRRNFAAEK